MPVILCNNSALEYYRTNEVYLAGAYNPAPEYPSLSMSEAKEALSCAPRQNDIDELLYRHAEMLTEPLHLAIKSNKQRPRRSTAVFHTLPKDISPTSLKKTPGHFGSTRIYLYGIPLLLSQLSLTMSYGEMAMICYEFCGLYRLSNKFEDVAHTGFVKTDPLCSTRSLATFTRLNPSVWGTKRLNLITKYTCDHSASPMETALSILLCFPTKWGGYGIPKPKLNQQISIPHSAQLIANKRYFVCDMLWPKEKLVIEYDSNQFHTGIEHISHDALKRNILSNLGYTVITVTSDQVFNANKTHELAKLIAKHLKIRFRRAKAEPSSARFNLRSELLCNHPISKR